MSSKRSVVRSGRIRDQRGFILITTFMLLLLLATLGSAAALYSTLDLESTSHFNTGNDSFYVAEAGILHGLNAMNTPGVVDFNADIVQRWSTLFGPSTQSIPGYSDLTYTVSVAADAANPTTQGTITAIGMGPNNSRRIIQVSVKRGPMGRGLGALYLASDNVSSTFQGNSFNIDGNNHDQFDNPVTTGPVEPGIATRNDTSTSAVVNSLNNTQKNNVLGEGFSTNPLTPSVITSSGPSNADLDQITNDILASPNVVTSSASSVSGSTTFGTLASPQITHLTASDVTIMANGNASGAGILIVDGSLTVNGTLNFTGWIIVRGSTNIGDTTDTSGNATILGALWTGDVNVKVGGSAILNYCQFCMTMVDNMSTTSYTPKAMVVTHWHEVL